MDPPTVPVPAKELPDSHPGTSSQLDRANLVKLIRNVVCQEIASHAYLNRVWQDPLTVVVSQGWGTELVSSPYLSREVG